MYLRVQCRYTYAREAFVYPRNKEIKSEGKRLLGRNETLVTATVQSIDASSRAPPTHGAVFLPGRNYANNNWLLNEQA